LATRKKHHLDEFGETMDGSVSTHFMIVSPRQFSWLSVASLRGPPGGPTRAEHR